ncbi:MAG: glycosyltransferase [Planctomycetia bacterium]|nr:glycosyltransferase [Planctomycetia bacterium]
MSMKNIICMKWGNRYDAKYVNILAAMVKRHLTPPYRFVCFTDNVENIHPEVETFPLPEMQLNQHDPERGWRKLTVFQEKLADLSGPALYLDLDVVILNSLDDFFTVPGEFRIIKDWNLHGTIIGNSSVFRFEIGKHPDVLHRFYENRENIKKNFRNEQAFLSFAMHEKGVLEYWDADWCKSFKTHCMRTFPLGYFMAAKYPGTETKIVVFHGKPNPHEICKNWHSHIFLRSVRPTSWFLENWHE